MHLQLEKYECITQKQHLRKQEGNVTIVPQNKITVIHVPSSPEE